MKAADHDPSPNPWGGGMTYSAALTALIDQQYQCTLRFSQNLPGLVPDTRDQVATSRENIRIADLLFGEQGVGNDFYDEIKSGVVEFGVFDNYREYGLTASINGWTFCAYEHRNSDAICIEGCPTGQVESYGPYGGEDKYDVLFSTSWMQYWEARKALVAGMNAVRDNYDTTRAALKAVMEATR